MYELKYLLWCQKSDTPSFSCHYKHKKARTKNKLKKNTLQAKMVERNSTHKIQDFKSKHSPDSECKRKYLVPNLAGV